MAEVLANNAASTLSAAITGVGDTSCTVANGTVFPATGNFRIIIDSEIIIVGARSGNTLSSLTRGAESTTAATHLNGAAVTHVLTKGGLDQYLPGQLDYAEITVPVTVSATTEGAATNIVSGAAVTYDGATAIMLEFWAPAIVKGTTNINIVFFDGATPIGGLIGVTGTYFALSMRRRLTPSAAAHTYHVKAWVDASTGTVYVGAGGAGVNLPGFLRITRA